MTSRSIARKVINVGKAKPTSWQWRRKDGCEDGILAFPQILHCYCSTLMTWLMFVEHRESQSTVNQQMSFAIIDESMIQTFSITWLSGDYNLPTCGTLNSLVLIQSCAYFKMIAKRVPWMVDWFRRSSCLARATSGGCALYCLTGPNLQYDFLNLGTISRDGLLFPPSPLLAHQLDCYATHQYTAAQ